MTAVPEPLSELMPSAALPQGEFVLLGFPDMNGLLRGKALRREAFATAAREGTTMTDLLLALDPTDTPITAYEGFGLRSGAGDLVVHADESTLRELSWLQGWQVCIATPSWRDGGACELASREVLRRALGRMQALGFETVAAVEYEVRLRDAAGRPLSAAMSYSFEQVGAFDSLLGRLLPALDALGVELTAVHTEAGPGLLELNLAAREGLRAADDATYVKLATKAIASSMGLSASFLAKSVPGEEGSSGHVHVSLWRDGENAFASSEGPIGAALAGILEHLPAASLLLNPTINSYKRLVPGWFAPVNVSWGVENRSAALRAIASAEHPERSRIECRRPGADANPYLALAVLLAAAAEGIERDASPPAPVEGDASQRADLPPLPRSLESALHAFSADGALRQALGVEFSDYYATSRRWELEQWQQAVSEWERDRYSPL